MQGYVSGVNDHRETKRRAEQQVYVKKALRSLAKRYLECERVIEVYVKIPKKKNGPENVFQYKRHQKNIRKKKMEGCVKMKLDERKKERESVYECMRDA